MIGDLIKLYADANIRVAELERENAALRNAAVEVCMNARLQMELDASWNAEELRQVRAENAQLRKTLADTTNL